MEQGRDGGVGEGGDEGPEGLEGGHPHPPALVPQQVDEERREILLPDLRRTDAGHGHEDVSTGLPDPPDTVLAQGVEDGALETRGGV